MSSNVPSSFPSASSACHEARHAGWRIDPQRLAVALGSEARSWEIQLAEETGSTNADLVQTCRQRPWGDSGIVRLAYRQTAGRGRHGRPWQGQAGMTFSVALPFALKPAQMGGLSLAVGLAVAEALADCHGPLARAVGLKWPNDLQIDGRKLAGILIESVPAGPGQAWAVIGIGLNLLRDAAMEQALGRELAGVQERWPAFDAAVHATDVLAAVLNRLAAMRAAFLDAGFGPMARRWSERDAYRDQPVRLLHDGAVLAEGMARGVDEQGHLLLETGQGLQRIASGELSLRPGTAQGAGQ